MMPLTVAGVGVASTIKKIGGKEETRKFLENLGFVVGGTVTVVSEIGGNMIVIYLFKYKYNNEIRSTLWKH